MEVHPLLYNSIIDPLLASSRKRILKRIRSGSRVIDIASGTGQLTRELTSITPSITGIDLEESMIRYSLKKINGFKNSELTYKVEDARNLKSFGPGSFDVATLSLALHQFSRDDWPRVLKEILRISNSLLILDYNYPLPAGYRKHLVYIIERIAGKEHSKNFRDFMKAGGVIPIIESNGFICEEKEVSGSGIFCLYSIKAS